jgi:hypothetical protein
MMMQALIKLTNNDIRSIDLSHGINMNVKGETIYDSSLTIYHCVNLVFYYKEEEYYVFSSMVSEEDPDFKEKLIMLDDLLSFVAKETLSIIFAMLQDGKLGINLISIVDNIIKSNISPVDAPIVENGFVLYNNIKKKILDDFSSWEKSNANISLTETLLEQKQDEQTELKTEQEEK